MTECASCRAEVDPDDLDGLDECEACRIDEDDDDVDQHIAQYNVQGQFTGRCSCGWVGLDIYRHCLENQPQTLQCVCTPEGGCDEEGTPGCAYCKALDSEEPCPAEDEGPWPCDRCGEEHSEGPGALCLGCWNDDSEAMDAD